MSAENLDQVRLRLGERVISVLGTRRINSDTLKVRDESLGPSIEYTDSREHFEVKNRMTREMGETTHAVYVLFDGKPKALFDLDAIPHIEAAIEPILEKFKQSDQ